MRGTYSVRKAAAAALLLFLLLPFALRAQSRQEAAYHPEEIEWVWAVRPAHADAKLPNVALVGDSITRNYYPEVQRQLLGLANVYLFSSSISVGDPRLGQELADFAKMEGVAFSVVHFNNGLHGWEYSEEEFRRQFPSFVNAVRAMGHNPALIWATITPVKEESDPGPRNARVASRNAIALEFIRAAGIEVDPQYELMMKHPDLYQDKVHFNEAGSNLQGEQAAACIRKFLKAMNIAKPHTETKH